MEDNSGANNPKGKKNLQTRTNYWTLMDFPVFQCATSIFCGFKACTTWAVSQTFSKNTLNHYRHPEVT